MHRDLLPLFPLPIVLFPGSSLPLHIFEPRYRRMLADVLAGDRRFGLIRLPQDTPEMELPVGTVGCIAEVTEVEPRADGRSDIVVRGGERFRFAGFAPVADAPYHVAATEPYEDEPEAEITDVELQAVADRLRATFARAAQAARQLVDDHEPVPEVPDEPALTAFAIAAMVDLDAEVRQALLASRSPMDRLRRLESVLAPAARALVGRADVHERAKSNGNGARPIR